jgi:hypothetical protein
MLSQRSVTVADQFDDPFQLIPFLGVMPHTKLANLLHTVANGNPKPSLVARAEANQLDFDDA